MTSKIDKPLPQLGVGDYVLVPRTSLSTKSGFSWADVSETPSLTSEKKEKELVKTPVKKIEERKELSLYRNLRKKKGKKIGPARLDSLVLRKMMKSLSGEDGNVSSASRLLVRQQLLHQNHYVVRMTRGGVSATTTAAGTLSDGFSMDPSTFDEWSSFNTLFDEFRVLGGTVRFIPKNRYVWNTGSFIVKTPLVVAYDNDSATVPVTTLPTAWQYPFAKPVCITDPYEFSWRRPNITSSAYWDDVATPSTSLGICFMISEPTVMTASTEYGNYFVEFEVEFRSRK